MGPGSLTTSEVGTEYPLASFPVTQIALTGEARLVSIEDPYADPAESAIVDGMGCVELLIAGGESPSGDRWLIEIFGDEFSSPMKTLAAPLRALIALALAPRSALFSSEFLSHSDDLGEDPSAVGPESESSAERDTDDVRGDVIR